MASQSEPTPQNYTEPADDVVSTPGDSGYHPGRVQEVQNTAAADEDPAREAEEDYAEELDADAPEDLTGIAAESGTDED